MNGMIDRGYATKVISEDVEGCVWYIPHHGIYHPKKPDSLRVVFDCSSRFKGRSLNDHLLQGPDLTSKLVGVLTRFRHERIAVMADIEKMFYQVKVTEPDQDYLRFLWWPSGDLTREPTDYCMTVHLFGAGSSPGCANYALRHTADEYEKMFGLEVANTLRRNFYVDDMLKSVPTEDDAVSLVKGVKSLCAKGGFNLTKFVSNGRKVMEAIPEKDRAKEIKGTDLSKDKLPIERALGVHWCVESDTFKFRIQLKDQPCTRRGMLSTICSIYDPLGFIAPVVLVGKKILQDICNVTDWDEAVPEEIRMRWEKWRGELPLLEELSIARCFKPPEFGKTVSVQLHSMSDASMVGYGQCSYLRLVDEHGKIHCSFVAGKARVTPKKTISIPRLELAAAAVSVKVADTLTEELEHEKIEQFYWTDSKVTLGFINNESRRFHVFVANRVELIRSYTSPFQWKYVDSSSNPADEGSRGMKAKEFLTNSKWLDGPEFLRKPEEEWPKQEDIKHVDPDLPEVKKVNVNVNVAHEKADMVSRLKRFSSWQKAVKAVALCLRYKKTLRERVAINLKAEEPVNKVHALQDNKASNVAVSSLIGVQDLENAEKEIVKIMQKDAFTTELKDLKEIQANAQRKGREFEKKKKAMLKRSSPIHNLDPFVDSDQILRVGGRIRRAKFEDKLKTPVILPRKGHLTKLLIRHVHVKVRHGGRGMTLNELRSQGFWIVGGNSAVRQVIFECVTCRRLRGAVGEQKMADLPKARTEEAPPFTYTAVDYFGPWYVKQGRSNVKRYAALFTCMASRAVHVEIAHSMETDSFLQALRRFICRRGSVRELRSDRGSNFIGAERELKEALKEMDDDKIKAELLKEGVDWIRNPASASNFGGVWERQIRSIRNVMNALLLEHCSSLDDESLRTFMCEAEAIINERPLTVETLSDPTSLLPLTPNMLLTGKTKLVLPPPGKFQREDVYCRRRWRRVQHVANEFWHRWRREYMQILQERQKWTRPRRNFIEGDIVMVKDINTPRNAWLLARVISTNKDDQGLVRSVTVQTSSGSKLDRPVNKLVLLVENP